MTGDEVFHSGADPALGHLLREHLDPGGHDAFVARVLASAAGGRAAALWDSLARWAGPGIAAALLIGAGLALEARADEQGIEQLDVAEAIVPVGAPATLLTAQPGGPGIVLDSLLEAP
ncbi:MAG TPA: hypothetical protein VFW66_08160 [Gemmatimonadales bacterium]|nr:hypothetical protein [Gemmatimonadales bacterium]